MLSEFKDVILKDVLGGKGYIRGPFGSALKRGDMIESGMPVYEQQHAIYNHRNFRYFIGEEKYETLKRFTVAENDLIISCSGTVGKVSMISAADVKGIISQALLILRPDINNILPKYLYYFLSSNRGYKELIQASHGSVQVNIAPRAVVSNIPLKLPNLNTQKKIVEVLVSIDNKIELNQKMNQTLEEMAQALFKSWFVDFDPVYAKANATSNADFDRIAKELGISREVLGVFPDEFEESELGMIPKGWKVEALDDVAYYQNGLALQKHRPLDENHFLPVLKISQLKKGYADGKEKADPTIKSECIVNSGDIVFSWSGSLVVDVWCGGKVALNQHLFKVTSDKYSKWFYYYWTKQHLMSFQKIATDKAVTMGHIKRSHLTEALCIVPDDEVFSKAEDIISPLLDKLIMNKLEVFSLQKTRDALLPKLLSGELDVSELELDNVTH